MRAEALHDTLGPDAAYPLEFIAFRLTGFRRDYGDDSLLVGSAVRPDLRLLIDQLSRTLVLPMSEGNARTVEQLAADLNVSTKTLSRWRKDGLRWRWVVAEPRPNKEPAHHRVYVRGGRALPGHPPRPGGQGLELYPAHPRPARPGYSSVPAGSPRRPTPRSNQVAAHLARRTGRALETVRLILEKHDRDHPDEPLFADRTGPLTARQKRLISRAHRMGVGVGKLAERFRRSRATIHRVILDRRAARAMRLRLEHVANPQFDRPDAADVYLRANLDPEKRGNPAFSRAPRTAVPVDELPPELRPLYIQPVVSPDKIRSLFLRYNFLKHRAQALRERFAHAPARARDLDGFEQDVARAARVRSLLVTWHLPVVLSVARRHLVGKPSNTPTRLIQLLEVGNPILIDTVETYDAAARPTFESVLTNRLLQAFATAPGSHRGKALRRATAAEVMQRMLDLADESGVHLAITEPPPEDASPAGDNPSAGDGGSPAPDEPGR